jgi:hypothetical protein
MEAHLHWRVLGVIDWPKYRFFGRCWAIGCGLPMALHTPWRLYDCERTPMSISITEQGRARLAYDARTAELADLPDSGWQLEDVVPVTARGTA